MSTFQLWIQKSKKHLLCPEHYVWIFNHGVGLTLSLRRSISYRHQSNDLQSKSMDWFLYDRDLCHERFKGHCRNSQKGCSVKKLPLKISQISQENNYLQDWSPASNFIKKTLQHRCFPRKFEKLLRTPILTNISEHLVNCFLKKTMIWHGPSICS